MLIGDGALALVEVVVPAVGGELAGVDLDDLVHDPVHELLVVGGHEDGARIAPEELLEPDDRLEVEVVGGLVEEQCVGRHEEDAGQGHAHLPAARERAHVAVHGLGGEPQAGQDLAGPGLEAVSPQLVEAGLDVAEPLDQLVHLVDPPGIGEGVLERVQLGGHRGDGTGAVHGLGHGAPSGHLAHVLREVTHGDAAVDGDLSLVGRLLPGHEPEEGGLAGAVRADETDLLPRVDHGGCLDEEDLVAVLHGDGVEADQGVAFYTRRAAGTSGARRGAGLCSAVP